MPMKCLYFFLIIFVLIGIDGKAQTLQLESATYIGGSGDDRAHGMALDAGGNVLLTAPIMSTDFPVTAQAVQKNATGIYAARLSTACDSLLLSTYLGLTGGFNYVHSITVDEQGYIYVYGNTTNTSFPTTPGAFDRSFNGPADQSHGDVFVMKLSPNGDEIVFSTLIGGSGMDLSGTILLDNDGNVVLSGCTSSTDLPVTAGAYDSTFNGGEGGGRDDVFIAKLSADGSQLLFCTYIGGSVTEPGAGIVTDEDDNVYLFGTTSSADFPTTDDALQPEYHGGSGQFGEGDAFVAKLSADGKKLLYSTFIGGSKEESISSVVFGPNGNGYLLGTTNSTDFAPGIISQSISGGKDGFVLKLTPDMNQTLAGILISGSQNEAGLVGQFVNDKLILSGETESADLPVTHNALDVDFNGNSDRFIAILGSDLQELEYVTYWGGSGYESGPMCIQDGHIYLAGTTTSRDLPMTVGAYDTTYNGGGTMRWGGDVYVAKFSINLTSHIKGDIHTPQDTR